MKIWAKRMELMEAHFFAGLSETLSRMRAEGKDVIRLDEGAPDLAPPQAVVERLREAALKADRHSYQPHRSTAGLRQAWADMYKRQHGVELDPDREVLPLLGSKEGIFHLSLACVEAGDVVIAPDPGYITYVRGALAAGGEAYRLPLKAEKGYQADFNEIPEDVLGRVKLVWLNYPNNPTGATVERKFFTEALDFAQKHDLLMCHDSAYSQVTYDGYKAPSILEIPGAKERAVEFNSLSKSHNMAGWRCGVLCGNAQVVQALYTLKTNADSGHFLPVIEAATTALGIEGEWIAARNKIYQERRDVLVQGLRRMGIEVRPPQAGLYVWCRTPEGWDGLDFTRLALEQALVSLTPGEVFGAMGKGFVRIALTSPVERIEQAIDRLEKWLAERAGRR